ncbi:hypothetical protein Taro_031484 [Colocasia esculenta]|uniref:Uncharacterized protein n=1 Tax=Colocasia esculenta TaxID=4460 RepID=A0A843VZ58_COLES|nr:hypothetical protein [Colocasia esculenta]
MDRFRRMPDREDCSRIGEEGREGASRIPNVSVDDRMRVPEYPFFHEGRLDNLNAFSANRGMLGEVGYGRVKEKTWPGAEKFAQAPLTHEGDLNALFWEGVTLGENMYIPSSGVIPPDDQQNVDEYVEASMEDEDTFEGSIGTWSPLERNGREESQEQSTDRKRKFVDVGDNAMQKKEKEAIHRG